MRDGEAGIYSLLCDYGPLPREHAVSFLSETRMFRSDQDYLQGCTDNLLEDGIVAEEDGLLVLKKKRYQGVWCDYDHRTHRITTPEELKMSEEERYVSDVLKNPYQRLFIKDEEGGYSASIVEFQGCFAGGATVAEAAEKLEKAAKSWLLAVLEKGQTIPEPRGDTQRCNGKVILRLPKYIHSAAVQQAALEGTSLNQFILSALSVQLGRKSKIFDPSPRCSACGRAYPEGTVPVAVKEKDGTFKAICTICYTKYYVEVEKDVDTTHTLRCCHLAEAELCFNCHSWQDTLYSVDNDPCRYCHACLKEVYPNV
jgi:predicted RNase H-like HicB family nuclease